MTLVLVRKLLRDVWPFLLVVAALLFAFETLWAKMTHHIRFELLGEMIGLIQQQQARMILSGQAASLLNDLEAGQEIQRIAFKGPGQIIQAMIGGESINLMNLRDMMSIGYVHPLVQTILCVWAVGRAAGAIAGELDRGTMELLLAQPVPRWRLLAAHLGVDLVAIPLLCLCMWAGTWLGLWLMGMLGSSDPAMNVDPWPFGPALINTGLLIFAVSGYTVWLSSLGRFRNRVLGVAVIVTLLQFLVNVLAQIWTAIGVLRPFTVFYYYQPQPMILHADWATNPAVWYNLGVLAAVGLTGYGLALWTFNRRDLPAPL